VSAIEMPFHSPPLPLHSPVGRSGMLMMLYVLSPPRPPHLNVSVLAPNFMGSSHRIMTLGQWCMRRFMPPVPQRAVMQYSAWID